jgi:hypothetical protein
MVGILQRAGLAVTKGDSIMSSVAGAEISFWILLDGKRVAAYRFDSLEKAREKAEGFENGVTLGYWAFEYMPIRYIDVISQLNS